jgi:hypothetical protein
MLIQLLRRIQVFAFFLDTSFLVYIRLRKIGQNQNSGRESPKIHTIILKIGVLELQKGNLTNLNHS